MCTVWWQVCAHGGGMGRVVGGAGGGVKRQRSGTPSWGERVCVCGTHRGWCGVLGLVTKGGAE